MKKVLFNRHMTLNSQLNELNVKSRRRPAILNLIELIFFMVYSYLKLHILFDSNDIAIWSGFLDITHFTKIMALGRHDLFSVLIMPNFKII